MSDMKIKASPTKAFFINMLVRDINLKRAILDLIDNAVDGAKVTCGCDDLAGYQIDINLESERFTITDNCGGIKPKDAQEYAFRFGRPGEVDITPGSIGRFGVGMKRTIFKIGNYFRIESTTKNSTFTIEQDVDEWLHNPDWEFEFASLETDQNNELASTGTTIEVTKVHKSISEDFDSDYFKSQLIDEIEKAYPLSLNAGLVITLNGVPVNVKPLEILASDSIKPAFFEQEYVLAENKKVSVKIFAGLAERSKTESGWYVFCNGRMVLEHDQTILTGWGETNGGSIPKFHTNFAFFRGYVFFSSDDAGALPWTTTKTGLDTDLPIYKAVRQEMIKLMRPIITFQSELAKEKSQVESGDREESPLLAEFEKTTTTWFDANTVAASFTYPPQKKIVVKPRVGRIQYNKEREQISKVKKALGVTTNKDVGELTFDYFYENECE